MSQGGRIQDKRRPLWVDAVLLCIAAVIFLCFIALGNWQVRRLAWKVDLIETVDARVHQEPATLPDPVTKEDHEYFRAQFDGVFLHEHERKVKAVTVIGPGYWVMTPLEMANGTLWVNRGFVPNGSSPEDWRHPNGSQTVTGLIRMTEDNGAFLDENDPQAERWVARDVAQLSEHVGITALPYFVDAEHEGDPVAYPRGGLTVIKFRNSHLSYALTWYAMAALFFAMMAFIVVQRLRGRPLELSD